MLIISIRTDKPDAEIGLFRDGSQLDYCQWQAHRKLAESIHQKINDLLQANQYKLKDVHGVLVYKGPGSFTGLRIGISVANALASGLNAAVVSANTKNWINDGLVLLEKGENKHIVVPEYGAEPHITKPKH